MVHKFNFQLKKPEPNIIRSHYMSLMIPNKMELVTYCLLVVNVPSNKRSSRMEPFTQGKVCSSSLNAFDWKVNICLIEML